MQTLLACLVVAAPSLAMAHGRMLVPLNRAGATDANNVDMDGGFLNGPCGGVAKATPHSYVAGSTLNITFETTIPHTGSTSMMEEFDFYWSPANDTGLYSGTAGPTALKKIMIAKPAAAQSNQGTLVLPSTPAANGTLQMVMVDLDAPASPLYWYSCVDITLTAAISDDGGSVMDLSAVADASASVTDGGMDLSATTPPADMSKRPSAGKAGLPGCSMAPGSSPASQSLAVFGFLLLAFFARRTLVRSARR
jgi:hypothetical protein